MNTLPVVEWLTLNSIYTLTSAITAFGIPPKAQDSDRCGPICELPEGAKLELCGGGFNKRTVMVRYGDGCYCVFWRDLSSASISNQTMTLEEQWTEQWT